MTASHTSLPAHSLPDPAATDALGEGSQPLASSQPAQPIRHLNQACLARRWNISHRTLERWRWLKQGPAYLKIGGRVLYRLEEVEAFEAAHIFPGRQ